MTEQQLREEAKLRGMDEATTENFVKSGLDFWAKHEGGIQKQGPNKDLASSDR